MTYPTYWNTFSDIGLPGQCAASTVKASDGVTLHRYEWGRGNSECIVLAAPIGVPFLLLSRLASALGRSFHVVGWETRGAGYLDEDCSDKLIDVERQALDLKEILEDTGIRAFHAVGWCAGTNIVCWLAQKLGVVPETALFIAPSNIGASSSETPFNTIFVPLIRSLSGADERKAAFAFKTLRDVVAASKTKSPDEEAVKRLTALNYQSIHAARCYARLLAGFSAANDQISQFAQLFDDVCHRVPSLVIHCMDDEVVSWMAAVNAVGRSKKSRLVIYPTGGHYVAYGASEQAAREIGSFLAETRTIA